MSPSVTVLAILCGVAFAAGAFSKAKSKITNTLLFVATLATLVTISLVSAKEQIPFQEAFAKLLTFDAHAAKASLGLYAVLALLFFCVGALMNRTARNAT